MKEAKMIGGMMLADKKHSRNRIMVGIPTTGLVRYEWVMARYGQVIPCNWSQKEMAYFYAPWSPIGFQVADARNIIAHHAIQGNFEWLLFIDHDTCPPPNMLIAFNEYMLRKLVPVVCGLYFTKSVPADPLVYRGFGEGSYRDWKMGDKVWCDGIPMGCTLIHCDVLRAMQPDMEEYKLTSMGGESIVVRKYFHTPAESKINEEGMWENRTGTEDLDWCKKVMEGDYLAKARFEKVAKREFPFLIDTQIFCKHIDTDGVMYPSRGEEQEFMRKK